MNPQQEKCLAVVRRSIELNGKGPRRLDLQVALDASDETITQLVDQLIEAGHLVRGNRRYETLRLAVSAEEPVQHVMPRQTAARNLMPITTWNGERPASPDEHAMPADAWDGEKLQRGEVCGDCWRFRRCASLLQRRINATTCNWSPSRWRDAE